MLLNRDILRPVDMKWQIAMDICCGILQKSLTLCLYILFLTPLAEAIDARVNAFGIIIAVFRYAHVCSLVLILTSGIAIAVCAYMDIKLQWSRGYHAKREMRRRCLSPRSCI